MPAVDWVLSPVATYDKVLAKTPPSRVTVWCLVVVWVVVKLASLRAVEVVDCVNDLRDVMFKLVRKYFGEQLGINSAIRDAKLGFLKEFADRQAPVKPINDRLPTTRNSYASVLELCKQMASINSDYSKGQHSGCVYHGGMEGYTEFINEAMALHQWTNPLHAEQFSGVRKMETEVISMVVHMFNGTEECCGAMTSGGTESILLAMKAYREIGRLEKGITRPEIVAPVTAHAAFDKAAHYFGLKIRHARIDPETGKVDMKHMLSLVSPNTIVLIGSAPNYPHGIIDPIGEIAAFGKSRNIPVHVDACLGGFIVAFMEKAGFPLDEVIDFRNEGVTSISCDTHKYGFAPKGSSTILYRSPDIRRHQMHSQPNWPGGIYASPTISGSRVGNVVAGTWAAMMSHGLDGYVESTKEIVGAARFIAKEMEATPGLHLVGKPLVSVVAVKAEGFDIYRLVEYLAERDWEMNALQYPPSMHICCTRLHAVNDYEHAKRLVADIRKGCAEIIADKDAQAEGRGALYGTTQTIPDRSIVSDVTMAYFDAYYDVHCKRHAN